MIFKGIFNINNTYKTAKHIHYVQTLNMHMYLNCTTKNNKIKSSKEMKSIPTKNEYRQILICFAD